MQQETSSFPLRNSPVAPASLSPLGIVPLHHPHVWRNEVFVARCAARCDDQWLARASGLINDVLSGTF